MQIKHTILAASAALVIGGAAFGVVAAQTEANTSGKSFSEVLASKLGVPQDKLEAAIKETRTEVGPGRGGFGFGGPGGPGRGEIVAGVRVAVGENHKIIADAIGITEDALKTELQAGKSIADVARAHNVDPKKVTDALVADANTRIDKAVTDGKITADQATKLKTGVATMAENVVNRAHPAGARGGMPGMPGMGGPRGPFILPNLETAAKAIGITTEQLRTELPGKSLSDVAKAHGVDPNVVAEALKKAAQEQSTKRIDEMMTQQFPAGRATVRTERGPRGAAPGGAAPSNTPGATTPTGASAA